MPWYWPFRKDSTMSETYSLHNPTLIEGISDDTILLFVFTVSLIGLSIYYSRRERNTSIHPDNRQDVELLRERAQQNAQTDTTTGAPLRVGRPRHDTCPICLTDSSVLSVETNCGHLFCGLSMYYYILEVTVLLTCFTADEEASTDNGAREMVLNDIQDFNRRFSGAPRSFREYISDIPVLIPHIIRQMFTVQNLAWTYRLRIILILFTVIAYVLSPLDILPESVLGFLGLFDDILVIFCAALYVIIIYRILIHFRPLLRSDELKLAEFLENLSPETRKFSIRDSYDLNEARELCFAINRYDKLRLVALINNETIIALFEFSLSILEKEYERFAEKYNIVLNEITDARFGPCISDQYQNRHLGCWLFEKTKKIARQMGKERLILWGGVFSHNQRAIRFYEKVGFKIFKDVYLNETQCESLDGICNLLE
ncbi:unnamed protein product [Rotaria sp. Silwood1]|nr:unnamed protein product [Rotaria sp. Silwood1]